MYTINSILFRKLLLLTQLVIASNLFTSGCDNGVYHTQKVIDAKNLLTNLGAILRNEITRNPKTSLRDIAASLPEFRDLKLSGIHDAKFQSGELIFLSDSQSPTVDDLFMSLIIGKRAGTLEIIILTPSYGIVRMPDVEVNHFKEWLAELGESDRPIIDMIRELRGESVK